MKDIILLAKDENGLTDEQIRQALAQMLEQADTSEQTLILPPDATRLHSYAGNITNYLYHMLGGNAQIMPALGTHQPMENDQLSAFFGDIPADKFVVHNWRDDVETVGQIPAEFVEQVSGGIMDCEIQVEINRRLLDPKNRLIVSVGQVVPHEIAGMANFTKNIVVGCGGKDIISKSHMLGAMYGMERLMGRADTPVRLVFDCAQENFLADLPIVHVLTVTTNTENGVVVHGLYIGTDKRVFLEAVRQSQQKNMTFMKQPFSKVVVYLDPEEFHSTWIGNKAIYRTRMAMAQGGELLILAPGVRHFGEDKQNDRVIRQFGYMGRQRTLDLFKNDKILQENQSVTAHLIHGSTDGKFSVTYAVEHLTQQELESVGLKYTPYKQAAERYNPSVLKNGFNTMPDGEQIFYIDNPAIGLWALESDFA